MFSLKRRDSGSNEFGWWLTDDHEDISPAEEPPCGPSARSYTPERLVRDQDYSILPSSPTSLTEPFRRSSKRHRRLSRLIDKKLVGASQLEALIDPEASDIRIPVILGRDKTFGDNFLRESISSVDILALANSESPRRPRTPDLMSSGSSCECLNGAGEIVDHQSQGRDDSDSGMNFLWDEDREDDFSGLAEEDPEIAVRDLRGRIEHVKDTNRDIFADISSLRKNFQWAEMKTGNLTMETTRLRREIRDLRYLDDLVNLLRGELERISQRNWPFNLGHADHHAEEVNLVV